MLNWKLYIKPILETLPGCKLWFETGINAEGKIVSNPTIGYGLYTIKYADGTTKDFFQVGLSPNATGISVYIMGLEDKNALKEKFGERLGKASVTGYCIRFKRLTDICMEVLMEGVRLVGG